MIKHKGLTEYLISLLSILVLVLAVGAPASAGWTQPGDDPWEKAEAAARARAQAAGEVREAPARVGEPAFNIGHLGYDKATGQWLEDPTARLNPPKAMEEKARLQRYTAQKLQGIDLAQIRFRSGYTLDLLQPGISQKVLQELAAASPETPGGGYYLIQFSYPYLI